MDDQYLTAAYQGETLGSRKLPSATLNAKSRRLTIPPKVNPSSNTTESKHLNIICKEASELAEINAEHAFRRLWEDNSWMYDFGTQSPSEKRRAKEMFRRNSNLFSDKGRRLSKLKAEKPMKAWQQQDFANLKKLKGKIFLVDEAERPDQAKLDAQPAELNYVRALKTMNANGVQKRKFKKLLIDSESYLNEKFEGKEAEVDPRAQFEGSGKRELKDDDADTDHDKEKKDKAKEDEKECDKQKDNGDESQECKDKKKEDKKESQDKKDDDETDPDDDEAEKRGLAEKKDDGKSEDVEDDEADENDAGNGESGELTDKKDKSGDDGGDRRSLGKKADGTPEEEQSEDKEDGDDEEEKADKDEEKSTETKDEKDEKKDKKKKAKAKDDDKTPKKKSENKKAARRLSVEKNLVDSFVLTGRVDGLSASNQIPYIKRGRRDRVLLTTPQKFDHNKPILSVSYSELKRLQQMEHKLTLKTRKLLKTLTALPKGGISLQTKIIKIYAKDQTNPKTPNLDQTLQNGDSRNIKFQFLDQKEFSFIIGPKIDKSGFRKIRLDEGKMS
jgi:hypothetical protein